MSRNKSPVDVSQAIVTNYDETALVAQRETVGYRINAAGDVDTGTAVPAEAYHPFGFQGRPNDADVDPKSKSATGARMLLYFEGNTLHQLLLDDTRVNATLPQLPKGGSRQYDAGGGRAEFDGAGNLTVTGGTFKFGGNPVPLALGKALSDLLQAIASCTPSTQETGLATIKAAAALITEIQTNDLEGT